MANGKKSGKIPVLSALIGALCIILYIGALSYGALNIYNSVTGRGARGIREFEDLKDLASRAGALGFMDERFIQTIQDAIDRSETILGVIISGSRGEFAFERERGTVISWVNNSPRFIPRFAVTRPPHHRSLQIEGQRNVNIQAVTGYLDYDFCIEILKRTLLIVLFSLTLAFFTLLMDALLTKNTSPGVKAVQNPAGGTPGPAPNPAQGSPQTSSGAAEGEKAPEPKTSAPAARKEPEESPEPPQEEGLEEGLGEKKLWDDMEDFDFDDDDDFPDFEDERIPESGKTAKASVPPASPVPAIPPVPPVPAAAASPAAAGEEGNVEEAGEPQGLFSPRGNVGWESYTEDRLESELHRSASTEQDLTLIAMAFREPGKLTREQFRRFAEEAVLYFEHRDLIFEYGERGLWVIRPNYSLEQALTASEEFNSRILSSLPRPLGSRVDLRFGISSRSGRLINAERIMMEAEEALSRAAEDPVSHSVAFKSDPEKYRQYISGRNPRSA